MEISSLEILILTQIFILEIKPGYTLHIDITFAHLQHQNKDPGKPLRGWKLRRIKQFRRSDLDRHWGCVESRIQTGFPSPETPAGLWNS